jgi:hypothetical protein
MVKVKLSLHSKEKLVNFTKLNKSDPAEDYLELFQQQRRKDKSALNFIFYFVEV